ncbi:MAG: SCO family protein [Bryobacteraceae bacterium]|nr:SCO family protein [Bryobacteraceae bacterium]
MNVMSHLSRFVVWTAGVCLASGLAAQTVLPPDQKPMELEGIGVEEKLGRQIDLNLEFVDTTGYPVPLKRFFGQGKPVILNLVYYQCPMLCNLVLNGQVAGMRELAWTPGNEYDVVTISIDPRESFDLAQKKRVLYTGSYERPAPGWHFLVDHQNNAKKLAEWIGFKYRFDEGKDQYIHSAAIMVLTPEGKVSRYLYGIKFRAFDLRLALTEASEGKLRSTLDKVLLFCYQYDPHSKSYVLFAKNFMRLGGGLTVLILGLFLWKMFRSERSRLEMKEGLA